MSIFGSAPPVNQVIETRQCPHPLLLVGLHTTPVASKFWNLVRTAVKLDQDECELSRSVDSVPQTIIALNTDRDAYARCMVLSTQR